MAWLPDHAQGPSYYPAEGRKEGNGKAVSARRPDGVVTSQPQKGMMACIQSVAIFGSELW